MAGCGFYESVCSPYLLLPASLHLEQKQYNDFMILLVLAVLQQSGWEFNPKPDTFSSSAMMDLRSMNEAVAGEHGYIAADKNGDFVRGDGQPIRFWAVNTSVGREKPWHARPRWTQVEPSLDNHARFTQDIAKAVAAAVKGGRSS